MTYPRIFVLVSLLLFCTTITKAQAPAGSVGQYQLGAGYASVSGPTDNGILLTFSKQLSPRVWVHLKGFMLSNPSGVVVTMAGPRYRPPLSALWKPSGYLDTSKFLPFVDLNLGAVKSPTGATTFAYGAGVGLDYQLSNSITLLVVEYDRIQSRFFPEGGINVSNINSVISGFKFTF